MAQDPRTIAQLKRKIELLEAKLAHAEAEIDRHFSIYREHLYETVEQRTRIEQAMRILEGTE
jgi:predicted  nucleic acid-binding Zn-ribbon protein